MMEEEVCRIQMQERIENYILGRLAQDEIDELWMNILKAPEWLGYLEVEVNLRAFNHNLKLMNDE